MTIRIIKHQCYNNFCYYILIVCAIFCRTNAGRLTVRNVSADLLSELTTTERELHHDTISASGDLFVTTDVAPPESFLSPVEYNSSDCSNNTCVRKCCPPATVLSFVEPHVGCVPPLPGEPSSFQPVFSHKDGRTTKSNKPVLLLTGFPHEVGNCTDGIVPKHRKVQLLSDGSLYTAHDNKQIPTREYCIDLFRQEDLPPTRTTITCYTEFQETVRTLFRYYAHSICLVMSCCCLVLLLATHIWEPRLRDLRGRCLMCHVGCMLTSNMALLCATLATTVSYRLCVAIGIILHFSLISTYMWLTVMCFDIWRYVRLSVKGIPSALLQGEEKQMFVVYSAAVWGTMVVIATVTLTLHFLPDNVLPEDIIRPHYGVNRCFIIEDDANQLVYVFSFLGILCAGNLLLVFMTMMLLYKGGAKICCFSNKVNDPDSIVFNNKHLDIFWNRFQIFMMTIVVWTTEVLSWKIPPKELWELTDIMNTLQGVVLLVIFLHQERKREIVLGLIRYFAGRAQQAAKSIAAVSDDTSSTLVSTFNEENLQGSDPETVDRIRKLSQQQETVASTMMKSVMENKITNVELQDMDRTREESDSL